MGLILLAAPLCAQQDDLAARARLGKELMAAGKFEEAIPIYRGLMRALPNIPGPIANLGIALHLAGHDREATRQLEAALKIDPSYLPARLYLGAAYLGLNEPAKAIEPLKKVVQVYPENTDAQLLLAEAFLAQESFEHAAEQFERLSEADPADPKVWNGLGRSYEGIARRNFEELEKAAVGSAYWLALVAETRAKLGQPSGAFYFFREALAKMPTLRGVHAAVAEIYRKTGHPDWAAIEGERERKLPPLECNSATEASGTALAAGGAAGHPGQDRRLNAQKLECDFWAGRYRELVASARDAKTAESYYWRARAYDKLALAAFSRLAQLPPSAEVHELIAKIHFSHRRCADAAKEWKKALRLSPGNAYYKKDLSISLGCSGDYEGAQRILEDLIKQSPDSAEINYWLGFTLLGIPKAGEAIPYLIKAVDADSSMLTAHREVARAYLQEGQAERALPHLKAALPIDKGGSIYYQLALAYRSTGQQELAKEMLRKFQEIQETAAVEEQTLIEKTQITPP